MSPAQFIICAATASSNLKTAYLALHLNLILPQESILSLLPV